MGCPSCGVESPNEARFCMGCGISLAGSCAACGHANSSEARFCMQCGGRIASPGQQAPTAPSREGIPRHLAEKVLAGRAALESERKMASNRADDGLKLRSDTRIPEPFRVPCPRSGRYRTAVT